MEIMVTKGENTVVAHLQHLKEHNETEFLKEGVQYLKDHEAELNFSVTQVMSRVHHAKVEEEQLACGCAGSEARSFTPQSVAAGNIPAAGAFTLAGATVAEQPSELRQWPVQMHLINPGASYFKQSDLVLAADCVAFSLGNFHSKWLKGKTLAIACPKLDSGMESYVEKIRSLIDDAKINTLTVMMMQVPCCGGLMQMVKMAAGQAKRNVPVKKIIVGVEGEILSEEWV